MCIPPRAELHQLHCRITGKLARCNGNAQIIAALSTHSRVLYLTDSQSDTRFLVDTGAGVSVIPPNKHDMKHESTSSSLTAANGSKINTYGERLLNLDFGTGRSFKWIFLVAQVACPILGVDFLDSSKFLIDISASSITDRVTNVTVKAPVITIPTTDRLASSLHSDSVYLQLLNKYPALTSEKNTAKPKHNIVHRIPTTGGPVYCKPRRLHPEVTADAKLAYDKLLADGVVSYSTSPWSCPLHMVPKKDHTWRPVGDYQRLNNLTTRDTYPLPHLQSFTDNIHGARIFSKIDLKDAFLQIPVHPDDVPKTTITTPFGAFQYNYMPFGLSGSSQTFQRFIDTVLRGLQTDSAKPQPVRVFAYIDDILIVSEDEDRHLQDLTALFKRLSDYGLRISAHKCSFGQTSLEFLGHHLTPDGITTLPEKVSAMKEYSRPTTAKDLRRYLGMINFYRRFVPNAARTLSPLYDMLVVHNKLPKNAPLQWDQKHHDAFNKSKQDMVNAALLAYPKPGAPVYLAADASDTAVGAVLQQQLPDGSMQPLGFFSRRLEETQTKWSIFGRELLAVFLGVKHFKHYLEGTPFTIMTDHQALINAAANGKVRDIARETRHLQFLSELRPHWQHLPGAANVTADALSRATPQITSASTIHSGQTSQYIRTINLQTSTVTHPQQETLRRHQDDDPELQRMLSDPNYSTVQLRLINGLYCAEQGGTARTYIPAPLRDAMLHIVHDASHPGTRTTTREVCKRFFWPDMKRDVYQWTRACLACQKAKVTRHNRAPIVMLPPGTEKFKDIHLDIVGPLAEAKGYFYILTAVDRYSRWTIAEPMRDATALTVADTFIKAWVQNYGVPETITTDRGSNFQSSLFNNMLARLGCHHIRTVAYRPQHNGMVERFHRRLKDALRASAEPFCWVSNLPFIMLSLRCALRDDGQPAPVEVVYGTPLTLPADLLVPSTERIQHDVTNYSHRLKSYMNAVRPIQTSHNTSSSSKSYVDHCLQTSEKVLIKNETKRGLQPNYKGPYKVLHRDDKFFTIELPNGMPDNVSIDRLKACHFWHQALPRAVPPDHWILTKNSTSTAVAPETRSEAPQVNGTNPLTPQVAPPRVKQQPPATTPLREPIVTRSGRCSKPPNRLQLNTLVTEP